MHGFSPSLSRVSFGGSLGVHLSLLTSMTKMEDHVDFLQWLQPDMGFEILMHLDDPSDLIRSSAVSRYWRQFVIANGLCKKLCLRLFPQLSRGAFVTELNCGMGKSADVGSINSAKWETIEREHRSCSFFLSQAFATFTASDCIADAISASSTDNYPEESICNTLDSREIILRRASYWSSKGQKDPMVPETLIYKLIADLCVITEISVQPFKAYFQSGLPIYSAKAVRFRMGHPKSPTDIENDLTDLPMQLPADDKFIWTYISQEFPMEQDNSLQKFKLPEAVLCVGGYLMIELLGRVQKQEMDGLFYICVSHVKVLGRSLYPAFGVEIVEPSSGRFLLKQYPEAQKCPPPVSPYCKVAKPSSLVQENWRDLEQWINRLPGYVPDLPPHEWDDDENDLDLVLM